MFNSVSSIESEVMLYKAQPPLKRNWLQQQCSQFVIKMLKQMDKGCLYLTLPNGETFIIGDPLSAFQAKIHVILPEFFTKVVLFGHVGVGEAYMAGDWETDDVTAVIAWAIYNVENAPFFEGSSYKAWGLNILGTLNRFLHRLRYNNIANSQINIKKHYDLSNEFFACFLDRSMTYSSALFDHNHPNQTLEEAQQAKYEALCQKIKLKATDSVLEIGTGWGGMAIYMAKTYGCQVTTITISQAQYAYAKAQITEAGLDPKIMVLLEDYRKIKGQFDKIVSIEMLEAVGDDYMNAFFAQCHRLLNPQGLLGIQYISCPDSRYTLLRDNVDFIQKHIFPGSLLPSVGRVNQAMNVTGTLFLHTLQDMGNSYAKTLQIWRERFLDNLPTVQALGFDAVFIRKWIYYLSYCEAAFAMRNITVVQAVYTRPNNLQLSQHYGGWQ